MSETLSFTSTILKPEKVKHGNPRPAGLAIFSQTLEQTTAHLVTTPHGYHQSSYERFLKLQPSLEAERKSWNPSEEPFLPDEPFIAVGLAYLPFHPIPAVY